jgi:CheY-like chemotaxis protein
MHILIIDDDEDARTVLRLILEAEGYQVEEASDGADALERLRVGSRPELILLDIMMPRLDGERFLKAMRGDPRLSGTSVFILSGDEACPRKAAELGADGCLVKPIEIDEVLSVVQGAERLH